MKVDINKTYVKLIQRGVPFWHANRLYMRICDVDYRLPASYSGKQANCVDLSTGELQHIPTDDQIVIANVHITNRPD